MKFSWIFDQKSKVRIQVRIHNTDLHIFLKNCFNSVRFLATAVGLSDSLSLTATLCAHWFYFPAVQLPVRGGGRRHLWLCRQVPDSDAGPTGPPTHDTTGVSPFNYSQWLSEHARGAECCGPGIRIFPSRVIRAPDFRISDPDPQQRIKVFSTRKAEFSEI